ncbi:MAG TPA: amino acid--tRNA ligase-related protein, partial [bacterium]|nr:amino acid--tRNA ligase-related protein [bacterium]
EAFSDYEGMMELVESMFHRVALDVLGTPKVQLPGLPETDLTPPWPRLRYHELLRDYAGFDLTPDTTVPELKAAIRRHGLDDSDVFSKGRGIDVLFSKVVEERLTGPVFVLDYPIELSPLAKRIPGQEHLTYRFEAFLYGMEMGNAFTELNDPEDQRRRFLHQAEERAAGDDEAMEIDEDFIEAMSHGMPPAGGLGVGVDRMAMVFTGASNLRDVILFPLLKEKDMPNVIPSATPALDLFALIEQAMAARGVSPGKLMKDGEIAKADFNAWKRGERVPDTDHLKRIAELLHIPLSDLTTLADAARIQLAHIGPEDKPVEPQSPESGES